MGKSYIGTNAFMLQSFQKVVKCILIFFFNELGLKQNGCREVKSSTGPYFPNICRVGIALYLLIYLKLKRKNLDFFQLIFSNGFKNQLF